MKHNCTFIIFSEILRVIDSLQLVDRKPEIATPANWMVRELCIITNIYQFLSRLLNFLL